MAHVFSRKTLAFLRALTRNNNRDWFRLRKPQYEQHVRGPMIDLLARLALDLPRFAPELISDPRVSLYRIYRDTRFSEDKKPLKTHVAAHFPARGFPRNEGSGLYLEVAPAWVWIGGGLYMPSSSDLRLIREHIAGHYRTLHRLVAGDAFKRAVGTLDGEQLSTMPRGYLKDHPAAHYLRFRQFLAGKEFRAEFATSPRFYPELLRIFRAVAPLLRFLNRPLLAGRTADLKVGLYGNNTRPGIVEAALQPRRRPMQVPPSADEALPRDRRRIDRHPEAAASRW
jgi:uncharacterized protein (TIGR02453 family)